MAPLSHKLIFRSTGYLESNLTDAPFGLLRLIRTEARNNNMKLVNIQHYISLLPELSENLRKLSKESIYLDKNENKWKYINGELCQRG